jgi:hypothetical protein
MNSQRYGFFPIFLPLAGLTAFALAPLYNLLGVQAEFFSANLVPPVAIILLSILASWALPLLLSSLVWASGFINKRLQTALFAILLFILAVIVTSGLISPSTNLPTVVYGILAFAIPAIFSLLYFRLTAIRTFTNLSALGALLFPIFFLFFSNVTPQLFPSKNQALIMPAAKPGKTYPPVIMVIFDEIALSSLLGPDGKVDTAHYPGFARIAKDASWFKGAHTVADNTLDAVPAIITGRYPEGTERKTAEKNDNIFTLLGSTHQLHVTEKVTQLCPPELCKQKVNVLKSTQKLTQDVSVVYQYLLLPKALRQDLPDITQNWGDFKQGDEASNKQGKKPAETNAANPKDEGHNHRIRLFDNFIKHIEPASPESKPPFYFIHILLPHVPFIFLPSGKYYGTGRSVGPHFPFPWNHDDRLLTEHYQRHLLQLKAADNELNKLLDKLQQTKTYDQSLIVIVADHGLNFRGGHPRRNIDSANYDEMLPVPLFIKRPNQKQAEQIQKPVRTLDIYATLADLMEFPAPPASHGISFFAKNYPTYESLLVCEDKHSDKKGTFPIVNQNQLLQQIAVKTTLFDPKSTDYLFQFGPHKDWIGKSVATLGIPVQTSRKVLSYFIYDLPDYQNVDLNAKYIPSIITGELYGSASQLPKDIWVAVNGTLWSTYPVLEPSGDKVTFYALIPEKGFHQGQNTINVLIPEGDANHPSKLWSVSAKR